MSLLTPIHFHVPSIIFGPLVAKYLAESGVSGTFWKKLLAQFLSYLALKLMGWVSWPLYIFVFLASFSAVWWPNIWPKMGFPELFEKIIGSIHFMPGIYTLMGLVFWPPIHFLVPSLIFGPLVAKYLAENGVSGTFWKNYWKLAQSTSYMAFNPYGVSLLTPIHFRVPSLIFGPLVAKYLAENRVSGTCWKNYWPNSFHTWHSSLWGESLEPDTFSCS